MDSRIRGNDENGVIDKVPTDAVYRINTDGIRQGTLKII